MSPLLSPNTCWYVQVYLNRILKEDRTRSCPVAGPEHRTRQCVTSRKCWRGDKLLRVQLSIDLKGAMLTTKSKQIAKYVVRHY